MNNLRYALAHLPVLMPHGLDLDCLVNAGMIILLALVLDIKEMLI